MTKNSGFKAFANLAFWVIIIGGSVLTLGIGTSLHLARKEVLRWTHLQAELMATYIQSFVDEQLQRVEDLTFTFAIDLLDKGAPATEEEMYQKMEHFLNTNRHICGIAIGWESSVGFDNPGPYGVANYVTNVSGENVRLQLGEVHDFHQKEWYHECARQKKPYWSRPYRETSCQKVVTSFCIPLYDKNGQLTGVLDFDIDTEAFRIKCREMIKYQDVDLSLVDRDYRFISNSDTSLLLHHATEVSRIATMAENGKIMAQLEQGMFCNIKSPGRDGDDSYFFLTPIPRNGWTISIEYPEKVVLGSVKDMRRRTSLISIASILIMILCFSWLFHALKKTALSKAHIESELGIASNIQKGMLRESKPVFHEDEGIDLYAYLKPARNVGGDLFDYCIRDRKLFFCIGDVSGKGVPAALFMAEVLALFRDEISHTEDPAEIAISMNSTLAEGNEQYMFCTMFLGVFDLDSGHLEFCNAGHNHPVLHSQKEVCCHFVDNETQFPLGLFKSNTYHKSSLTLENGDGIFLYTDGVTEAENALKNQFGTDLLLRILKDYFQDKNRTVISSQDIVQKVLDEVKTHAGHYEQSDDITVLDIEYKQTNKIYAS